MQRYPKQFSAAQLGTSPAALYTAPANTKATIASCTATNITAGAVTLTMTITPSGGTARNICYQRTLAAKESLVVYAAIGQTMEAGGVLSAVSDTATAVDVVVSGYETTV